MDANGLWYGLMSNKTSLSPTTVLVVGAGSRGNAYSRAITEDTDAVVAAVAEPIAFKRRELGRKYIWRECDPLSYQAFDDWSQFLKYETERRKRAAAGETVERGVDAVLVCTLDEQHADILIALAPLNLHILCEKPLATTLQGCLNIYSSLLPSRCEDDAKAIFGIGHVLRYNPSHLKLRELVVQERVIGDIVSIEHTEPVGWWHFTHSYVRGNWRKECSTAPSLLTKSCHDIDFLLWLLCSPRYPLSQEPPHLPSKITSIGHLNHFRKSRKPVAAGGATNCLTCPIEKACKYSAKKIYLERHLRNGNTSWPVKIVNPEIEDCYRAQGPAKAEQKLLASLAEDYTSKSEPASRPYFGRCVYEADNDVCDDQFVTVSWEDDGFVPNYAASWNHRAKTATFHMIGHTESICQRRGYIYGTDGEISYDSERIKVCKFGIPGSNKVYHPKQDGGGHGGGDKGLISQFIQAVNAVRAGRLRVKDAQIEYIGCGLEEILRSHAVVFAAEEARKDAKVVDWKSWWLEQVETRMKDLSALDGEYEIINA